MLTRKVKKDGKGLFFHYGPYRFRPVVKPSGFVEGQIIRIAENSSAGGLVVENSGRHERWISKT